MEGIFLKRLSHRIFLGAFIGLLIVSPSFSQGQKEDSAPLSIQKIEVIESTQGPKVAIECSKPFEYTVFKLANPQRIVVDLPSAKLGKLAGPIKVQNGIVNEIQNKQIDDPKHPRARIEIGLDQPVEYDLNAEGNYLFILLSRPLAAIQKQEPKQKAKTEALPAEKTLPKGKAVTDVAIADKTDWVEVEIKGDGLLPDYRSYQMSRPPRLVVDLPRITNAFSKKQIDVDARLLKNIRLGQTPEKLRMVFTFPGHKVPPYQIAKEGQNLKFMIGRGKGEGKKEGAPVVEAPKPVLTAQAETRQPAPIKETVAPAAEKEVLSGAKNAAGGEKSGTGRYKGARISLDFKDADVHNIFRLIAEVSDLNIITTEDVKGKVTIRMVNVPWDQALDVILSTKNLVKIEEGNVLRITTAENMRKEREEKLKEEKILTEHKQSLQAEEILPTETISVNYAKAADLQKLIKEKDDKGKGFLGPRGSVKADERTNTLIVQDSRTQIGKIQDLIKKLDTPTPQVLIEARIVQAVTTFARSLGIQWGGGTT